MSLSFELFPEDYLINLALSLPLSLIIRFCQTNKRFNRLICNNTYFWQHKFLRDFGPINYQGSWKYLYLNYLNVWGWGDNMYGQLGLGSDLRAMIPYLDLNRHNYPILRLFKYQLVKIIQH